MSLMVYNSLSRQKEPLVPLKEGHVGMYVCGVTVYDLCHIGHARAYLVFDVIRRYLRHRGYKVVYVQNITDIDDKIIGRAAAEKVPVPELTARHIEAYFKDMDRLGVEPADHYPKATEHIADMISLIEGLIEKGHAYRAEGDVFFDVASFPEYGKLSGRADDEQATQVSRLGENPLKRHHGDFALWKSAKPEEPQWESPWGQGRPGWHIECSAMSMKYLGATLDIHGGGQDLKFPHHENEIAQSEAYTGKPFAKYWVHNGFVMVEGQKMSKSLGNVVNIRDLLDRYPSQAVRLFFLGAHYRSTVDFSFEKLDQALSSYRRISAALQTFRRLGEVSPKEPWADRPPEEDSLKRALESTSEEFDKAMDEDFNTPEAVAVLHRLLREANNYYHQGISAADREPDAECQSLLNQVVDRWQSLGGVLGLEFPVEEIPGPESSELIDLFIEVRNRLREAKAWDLADLIRDRLAEKGILLEDGPQGTVARFVDSFLNP